MKGYPMLSTTVHQPSKLDGLLPCNRHGNWATVPDNTSTGLKEPRNRPFAVLGWRRKNTLLRTIIKCSVKEAKERPLQGPATDAAIRAFREHLHSAPCVDR